MYSLRQIVEKINENKIPIRFYELNGYSISHSLLEFHVLSDSDLKIYEEKTGVDKENFESKSQHITIPRIYAHQLTELYDLNAPFLLKLTLDRASAILGSKIVNENKDLIFSLCVILHEFGHAHHFDELGRLPFLWETMDDDMRRKNHRQEEEIQILIKNNADINKIESLIKEHDVFYRTIPMEKRADRYAEENLKNYFVKIYPHEL